MRCCWPSAARVLTLLSLALLSSQSLLLVNAQKTDVADIPNPEDASSPTATSSVPTSTSHSASQSPTNTSIPPKVTSPLATTSSTSSSSTSTSSPAQRTSSAQTPLPSPTSTTSSLVAFASATSSTSPSPTSSSSSSSSSLASSTSSSPVIPTSTSSSPGVTLLGQSGTTLVATATTNALVTDDSATSYTWSVSASSTATGGAAASSSKSFFDNKGAVAGTFTAAGAVVIGAIVIAVVLAKRRTARLQDEEDMTYFEKYEGATSTNASAVNDGSHTPTEPEMSYLGYGGAPGMDVNDEPLATHAAPDAYPDRAMHFGLPSMEEYAQPQAMGLDFSSAVDYPPGTSYNPTQYAGYEGYNPTQYAGYEGYNPTQYAGYESGYAQPQQPYYASSYPAQTLPAHPYANPTNSARMAGAPPVQLYGEAR